MIAVRSCAHDRDRGGVITVLRICMARSFMRWGTPLGLMHQRLTRSITEMRAATAEEADEEEEALRDGN